MTLPAAPSCPNRRPAPLHTRSRSLTHSLPRSHASRRSPSRRPPKTLQTRCPRPTPRSPLPDGCPQRPALADTARWCPTPTQSAHTHYHQPSLSPNIHQRPRPRQTQSRSSTHSLLRLTSKTRSLAHRPQILSRTLSPPGTPPSVTPAGSPQIPAQSGIELPCPTPTSSPRIHYAQHDHPTSTQPNQGPRLATSHSPILCSLGSLAATRSKQRCHLKMRSSRSQPYLLMSTEHACFSRGCSQPCTAQKNPTPSSYAHKHCASCALDPYIPQRRNSSLGP